jgi:hypothetical protein
MPQADFVMGSGSVTSGTGMSTARSSVVKCDGALFVNHRAFEAQITVNAGRIVFDVVDKVELLATMS